MGKVKTEFICGLMMNGINSLNGKGKVNSRKTLSSLRNGINSLNGKGKGSERWERKQKRVSIP